MSDWKHRTFTMSYPLEGYRPGWRGLWDHQVEVELDDLFAARRREFAASPGKTVYDHSAVTSDGVTIHRFGPPIT
jgi:hypothetical protein